VCSSDLPTISAYNSAGGLLGSFDLLTLAAISTHGTGNTVDVFVFRGIADQSADIKSFRMGGSYIVATGTADGAPLVESAFAPEPASLALLGAGLITLASMGRRTTRKGR
jgi:hypothetical protein